jgi:hypothetical protein
MPFISGNIPRVEAFPQPSTSVDVLELKLFSNHHLREYPRTEAFPHYYFGWVLLYPMVDSVMLIAVDCIDEGDPGGVGV